MAESEACRVNTDADDKTATLRSRVLAQVGARWMPSHLIAKRLGIASKDRIAYQMLCQTLRHLALVGKLERQKAENAGYHVFGTLVYRRRTE